jgi:hypothetical protein
MKCVEKESRTSSFRYMLPKSTLVHPMTCAEKISNMQHLKIVTWILAHRLND